MLGLIAAVAATAIVLAVSIVVGFSRPSRVRQSYEYQDYQVAGRLVNEQQYATASVGYSLQMAAVFLFASWGATYGLGGLWTVLFWFIGYFLLYILLPRFLPFLAPSDQPRTLHEHLRRTFGNSRLLQLLAALATLLGLAGVMMAEIDYALLVYSPVLNEIPPIAVRVMLLLVGLSYVVWHGYKAEIATEQWQVPFAYICFLFVLILLLPEVRAASGPRFFNQISLSLLLTLLLLAVAKVNFRGLRGGVGSTFPDWQISLPLAAVVLLAVVFLRAQHGHPAISSDSLTRDLGTQLRAQGKVALFSLLLANALWMPVDLSTWQRLESVRTDGGDSIVLSRLRTGTWRVMLESPASWCFGVILGWIIRGGGFLHPGERFDDGISGITALARALATGSLRTYSPGTARLLYACLVGAALTVMFSTVTSLLAALNYTVSRDIIPPQDTSRSSEKRRLNRVRLACAGIVVVSFIGYEFLRSMAGASISALLYAAYSAQLALFWVILLMLARRRICTRAAIASLIGGLLSTAISVAIARATVESASFVLPPLFALAGSFFGYLLLYKSPARPT